MKRKMMPAPERRVSADAALGRAEWQSAGLLSIVMAIR